MSTRPLNSISSPNSMPLIRTHIKCIIYKVVFFSTFVFIIREILKQILQDSSKLSKFLDFQLYSICIYSSRTCKDSNLSPELFLFFENYLSLPKRFEIQKSRRSNRKEVEKKIRTERIRIPFFQVRYFSSRVEPP